MNEVTNFEESSLTRCNILLIKANRSYLKLEKMESEELVNVIGEFPALYDITLTAYHNKVETKMLGNCGFADE